MISKIVEKKADYRNYYPTLHFKIFIYRSDTLSSIKPKIKTGEPKRDRSGDLSTIGSRFSGAIPG